MGKHSSNFSLCLPQASTETKPSCPVHQAAGEGRCPLAPSALAPQARSSPRDKYDGVSRELLNLPSPWLNWEGVGSRRLILGDFVYGAKRKETERPDGARDAHRLGKCDLCKPPSESSVAPLRGSQAGGDCTKLSFELGVFPQDLCHEGGHVSLFGVMQGKERVFHKF